MKGFKKADETGFKKADEKGLQKADGKSLEKADVKKPLARDIVADAGSEITITVADEKAGKTCFRCLRSSTADVLRLTPQRAPTLDRRRRQRRGWSSSPPQHKQEHSDARRMLRAHLVVGRMPRAELCQNSGKLRAEELRRRAVRAWLVRSRSPPVG